MSGDVVVRQLAELLLMIIAPAISASSTVKHMVMLYRAQAWVLTVVVLLTSVESREAAVAVLAVLPATLAVVVPPLLGRASLTRWRPARPPDIRSWLPVRVGVLRSSLQDPPANAELIWLQHGNSRLRGGLSVSVDMFLIATAVLVAYRLEAGRGGELAGVLSLAVAIALVLQGLFTMLNKQDIISQVLGLLVIEHGLFLAAVRVAPPDLALLFMVGLFFYALVTLIILVWILPELHRASKSIEVTDHSRLKG